MRLIILLGFGLAAAMGIDLTAVQAGSWEMPPVPQKPYVFRSLKGVSDDEMLAFFDGRGRSGRSRGMRFKIRLPDGFWELPPKQAALEFVESNRTQGDRSQRRIVLDEDEAGPPVSGWAEGESNTDGRFAVRFGVSKPWLITAGWVTMAPDADFSPMGLELKALPLTAEDARFLADTLYWLGQVRSIAIPGTDARDEKTVRSADLASWLCQTAMAKRLRHRAGIAAEKDDAWGSPAHRRKLEAAVAFALGMNARDPLPFGILKEVVVQAGEEGLVSQQQSLDALLATVPGDHALFTPLVDACDRLRVAKDPSQLLLIARIDRSLHHRTAEAGEASPISFDHESPSAGWAVKILQAEYLDLYTDFLADQFDRGDSERRKDLYERISCLQPEKARRLEQAFTSGERIEWLNDRVFNRLWEKDGSIGDLVPLLMERVKDRTQKDRELAISVLADSPLEPETREEFEELLVAELENPTEDKTIATAAKALSKTGSASRHLALLEAQRSASLWTNTEFLLLVDAVARASAGLPDQGEQIRRFLDQAMTPHAGLNHVFLAALAFDDRAAADWIAGFATESAAVLEGDRADWGGGTISKGQRYHWARLVTALWQESDPATLARMWVALVLESDGARFRDKDDGPTLEALKGRARSAILMVPAAERRPMIEHLIAAADIRDCREEVEWLEKLAAED